ncbi:MAG: hypothetical protein ACC645_12405, partial [Pirellulales bacterium]
MRWWNACVKMPAAYSMGWSTANNERYERPSSARFLGSRLPLTLLIGLALGAPCAGGELVEVGLRKQLLVDDYAIAER